MATKLITVFGATGQQGGSVSRALLQGNAFKVRAVTRNPASDATKALQAKGAEVVTADLDDKHSVMKAVTGAYGCFGVTNFWAHMDKATDTQQGINLVEACKTAGVQHLVYSGLENVEKLIGISCPHFDSKGVVEEYLQNTNLPFTSVRMAGYCENFLSMMLPQKIGEDKYAMFIPMGNIPVAVIPVLEAGECVHQIFQQRDKFLGKFVGLGSDEVTTAQLAEIMSKHLGKNIVDGKMSTEDYAKLGFPGAEDLAAMFTFYQSGKCDRDVALTRQLNPNISAFEQWVIANKDGLLKNIPQ